MFGIDILQAVLFLLAIFVSITVHEFSHALAAHELGDSTARNQGRLSLNPLVHFDPLGALMIVYMAIGGRGLGWGKPVPVNPHNLRGNRRVSFGLTAAAGPFSNLVLAALFAIPVRMGLVAWGSALFEVFWVFVVTNIGLAIFNLIPLPPLDGFTMLQGLLGTVRTQWAYDLGNRLDRFRPYGPIVLLALLSLGWLGVGDLLGAVMRPPMNALLRLLLG